MSWPEALVLCVVSVSVAYVAGQFWKAMSS